VDWELWCVDSTNVPPCGRRQGRVDRGPVDEPADHALGRSRGGGAPKIRLVSDGKGRPLAVHLTPRQAGDSPAFGTVLDEVTAGRDGRRRPRKIAADKAYSTPRVRWGLRHRRIQAVVPTHKDSDALGRRDPHFDRAAYRQRNLVQRCVGRLKEPRRIGTRAEKLAVNYMAMVKLAMIRLWIDVLSETVPREGDVRGWCNRGRAPTRPLGSCWLTFGRTST
jgi:transposase